MTKQVGAGRPDGDDGHQQNPSTAMAATFLDELARGGVAHVVVCPGSRSTALAIAAARTPGIIVHVRHDERSAAFTALGIGRATGIPAVVVTTSGTAVANLLPAVAEADMAGVPLLLVTADRPAELHDVGANQALRQADLLRPAARWHCHLPAATGHPAESTTWRSTAARAVAVASGRGGSPAQTGVGGGAGAVHCNLAFREPTVPGLDDGRSTAAAFPHDTAGRADGAPWTRFRASEPDASATADWLLDQLAGRRVLVVAGDAARPMDDLDRLPWPVVAEPTAGPSLATGLSHGSLLLAAAGWRGRHRPDVVLRLGHPTLSRPALVDLADVPTIQVTASGMVDPARTVHTAVTMSPAQVVAALADLATQGEGTGDEVSTWRQAWEEADRRAAEVVAGELAACKDSEPAVAAAVAGAVGPRALVLASSLPVRDVADHAGSPVTGRVYANRGLAGIDGFTSTAVGVATAAGPTVALAGDLAFLHDHNGLLVANDQPPPLTLVVVDNDGGGLFHHVPAVQVPEFERLFATPHGRDLAAIARAAGADADEVDARDLPQALQVPGGRQDGGGGVRVLVVRTDRRASAALRHRIVAAVDGR